MATVLRESTENNSTTGTAISVSAPTGTTTGDVVTISVHCNGNTTIVDNNGATPFTEDLTDFSPNTTSGQTVSLFSRVIQAGDPSTYNFTSGASGRWSIVAACWQNPNATFYDVAPSTGNAANRDDSSAATINAPSITTGFVNSIHVVCGYIDNALSTISSNPGGYTTIKNSTDQPQGVSYKVIASAGATGAQTITSGDSQPMIGLSFAIKTSVDATTRKILGGRMMMGIGS